MRDPRRLWLLFAELSAMIATSLWAAHRALQGLQAAGADIPVGPDPGLWGLASRDVAVGNPSAVPPLFPALLAWAGDEAAGLRVAPITSALVPAAVYAGVRAAGGGVTGALVAAALCLGSPDLYGLSLQLQPEAVTALAFALGAGALAAYAARRTLSAAAALIAAAALAALAREHGMVVPLFGALTLLIWPPPALTGARRLLAPAALVLSLAAAPVALGLTHAPPWAWPWGGKENVPLRDLAAVWERPAEERPAYARESVVREAGPGIDRPAAEAVVAAYPAALARADRGERVGRILRLNACWAWAIGAGITRWLGLGVAGAAVAAALRRRPALLASQGPLLAVLPLWIVWSQRRHVAVLLPVGAIGVGLGWSALEAWLARRLSHRKQLLLLHATAPLLAVGACGALVHAGRANAIRWERFLHGQADRNREEVAAGRLLRQRTAPGDALCADPDYLASVQLLQFEADLPYLPLGADLLPTALPSPDPGWRCYLVVRAEILPSLTVAPDWARVLDLPHRAVFRYKPDTSRPFRVADEGGQPGLLRYQGTTDGA